MSEKTIILNFETGKPIKPSLKDRVKTKLRNTKNWIIEHKTEVVLGIPIITGTAKFIGKRVNYHSEKKLKEVYCYDRSLGHYWRLKRDLSNKEWVNIENRRKNGERLADILNDMNVLK